MSHLTHVGGNTLKGNDVPAGRPWRWCTRDGPHAAGRGERLTVWVPCTEPAVKKKKKKRTRDVHDTWINDRGAGAPPDSCGWGLNSGPETLSCAAGPRSGDKTTDGDSYPNYPSTVHELFIQLPFHFIFGNMSACVSPPCL